MLHLRGDRLVQRFHVLGSQAGQFIALRHIGYFYSQNAGSKAKYPGAFGYSGTANQRPRQKRHSLAGAPSSNSPIIFCKAVRPCCMAKSRLKSRMKTWKIEIAF